MLTLLIGGARSGKSTLALELARRSDREVVFVATAEARDEEMRERIARHRAERPLEWTTVEEPIALSEALAPLPTSACVIVDCLTLWVANLLERSLGPEDVAARAGAAAAVAAARGGPTVAVTNEVGLGVVPATPLGRDYRDLLGSVNRSWADAAGQVFLVVAGRLLALTSPAGAHLESGQR